MSVNTVNDPIIAWCATCKDSPPIKPEVWKVGTRYRCSKSNWPGSTVFDFHVAAIIPASMKPWLGYQVKLIQFFASPYHPRNISFISANAERYGLLLILLMASALGMAALGGWLGWLASFISALIIVDLLAYNTMMTYVTQHPQVPMRNAIFGMVGFIFITLGFAVFYVGLVPDSLNHKLSLFNEVYFSFVTIATIGYGDFAPLRCASGAQAIVVAEILIGLYYLTVLIAAIVGWANTPTYLRTEKDLGLRKDG